VFEWAKFIIALLAVAIAYLSYRSTQRRQKNAEVLMKYFEPLFGRTFSVEQKIHRPGGLENLGRGATADAKNSFIHPGMDKIAARV
jgi:membrane protein implicated in regulation of membrane protease activity